MKTIDLTIAVCAIILAAPVAAGAQGIAAAGPRADDQISYAMPAGGTLISLANRYFERAADYRVVQQLNRIRDPRKIPVGQTLNIPVRLLRTEPLAARIQAFRGTVSIVAGAASAPPTIGALVQPGSVLETGKDGFASLLLSNGSQISLPTNTRVRLRALRRIILTDSLDYDIAVERGKIETRATPLPAGRGNFRIRTPRAVAAIRGTTVRVGYGEEASNSQAELLEGHVSFGAGRPTGDTMLAAGFGSSIAANGTISTESLLTAPDILRPERPLSDPVPALELARIAGASAYHVQIAADSSFADVVSETVNTGPLIALPPLPNGRWFAKVSAVSPSGLEGFSNTYSIRRLLNGIAASATQDGDGLLFKWQAAGEGTPSFRFQVRRGSAEADPFIDEPNLSVSELALSGLANGVYFWRVGVTRASEGETFESWLPFEKLTVADMPEKSGKPRR